MPQNEPTGQIDQWRGLNNVDDPAGLEPGWMVSADNVMVDDRGRVRRRQGYSEFVDLAISSAFATRDEERLYVISSGALLQVHEDLTTIATGFTGLTGPFSWCEAMGDVILVHGSGAIRIHGSAAWQLGSPTPNQLVLSATAGGALPAGTYLLGATFIGDDARESGMSPLAAITVDGTQSIAFTASAMANIYATTTDGEVLYLLAEDLTSGDWNGPVDYLVTPADVGPEQPPPSGSVVEFHNGRLWIGYYDSAQDVSFIFRSKPLQPHLFDLTDYVAVPKRVTLLGSTPNGLLITTDDEVYGWVPTEDGGEFLKKQADYGALSSTLDRLPDGRVVFWTKRGVAEALPLKNLTEDRLSTDPGRAAAGGIVELDGVQQYLVSIDPGHWAHNPAPARATPTQLTNGLG